MKNREEPTLRTSRQVFSPDPLATSAVSRPLVFAAAGMAALSMPTCFVTGQLARGMGEAAAGSGAVGGLMLPVAVILAGLLPGLAIATGLRARSRFMADGGAKALDDSVASAGAAILPTNVGGLLLGRGRRPLTLLWLLICTAGLVLAAATVAAALMFISGYESA